MTNWAGKELCNVGSQDQQGEQENDACHLGAGGFPEQHENVSNTHTQSHICNASVPSILEPASNEINFTFGTAENDLKRWVCS